MYEIDGANSIARGQHAIEGRRRAAALYVAQDHRASLKAGAAFDLRRQRGTDATQAHVPELICFSALVVHRLARQPSALRRHDDAEIASAIMAALDGLGNLLDVKRLLRNQNHISSA